MICEDLEEKMVFVGGPRQVGKTTLCRDLVGMRFVSFEYYNWDNRRDRNAVLNGSWGGDAQLIVLDEIHKYRDWKNHLKGEYDKFSEQYKFLITGSTRLDFYRRGGDSLQGRYHYYRLHPFSLSEMEHHLDLPELLKDIPIASKDYRDVVDALLRFGGFPEPLLAQSTRRLKRWQNERVERFFREDVREIEQLRDVTRMQLLSDMLPERAGSMLSLNRLREDLSISHRAVTDWMNILESFYYCFRVYPFARDSYKSLKKQAKLYLWDWSEVADDGHRFENMVASHLLKMVH